MKSSKSKQEVEFQYGGHLFSKTGSSSISATDQVILLKFGMEIVLDLLKCNTLANRKPEVHLRRGCRQFEKAI